MKLYSENFRGFKSIDIDLSKITFLIGDNSSGKSSILYLIDCISRSDLECPPSLDEDFGVSRYDYFSPYFSNADVIFAFYDQGENTIAKIITVTKSKGIFPKITRCSYYFNGVFLQYELRGETQFYRIEENIEFTSIFSVVELHKRKSKFKKLEKKPGMPIYDQTMIFAHHDNNERRLLKHLAENVINTFVPECRLISPLRSLPEKFYKFKRKIYSQGNHFATMWMDLSDLKNSMHFAQINAFGRESGLFNSISVQKVTQNIEDSPLLVTVDKNDKTFTLDQVGIGISQIVPILIESTFSIAINKITLLIQQPELHLHPVAQAALGSYFFKSASNGLRAVVETHSSFFLDRFRAELRESNSEEKSGITANDVEILFCKNDADGNHITTIKIDENGKLVNDPDEFHDFFISETLRTMF